jgi:hypothetical protein
MPIMTMVVVLMVVLAVIAIVGALEVTRRAAAGRQMERSYDALRPVEQATKPKVRPTRARPAVPVAGHPLEVPVRRAS